MSTANKLTYLSTTKQKIKQSINNLGGSITDNTTFRNYATELDTMYDNLPKISDTGTDVSLSPTLKGRLGLIPRGNTYQESTTGKNLFNKTDYTTITTGDNGNATSTKTNDKIIITTGSGSTSSGIYITKDNLISYITNYDSTQTYNISMDIKVNRNITMRIGSDTRPDISVSAPASRINVQTVIQNNGLVIYSTENNAGDVIEITNIMISTSSDTSYEPYTGGQPSPSSSYPQIPKVVTGENNIFVTNKNLLGLGTQLNGYVDASTLQFKIASLAIGYLFETNKLPDTITFNAVGGNRANISYFNQMPQLNTVATSRDASNSLPRTSTINKNYKYIHIQFSFNTADVSKIQVESGTTATEYVEHEEQNYPLSFGDIELVEIGDYADYIEGTPDNWVKKEVIEKIVLDGSETGWAYASVTQGSLFRKSSIYSIANKIPISNYFIGIQNSSGRENGNVYYNASLNSLDFIDNDYTNLRDFVSWLSTHNVIIYYVKSEPTDVPITDTTLINQLNALYYANSYNGITNISTTHETGNMPVIFTASALKDGVVLQNKSVAITENGTQNITPDTGYDGLNNVEITTNVSGADLSEYLNTEITENTTNTKKFPLFKKTPDITVSDAVTNLSYAFSGNVFVEKIGKITGGKNVANCSNMFSSINLVKEIDLSGFDLQNVTNVSNMFGNCSALENVVFSKSINEKITAFNGIFSACKAMKSLDLSSFIIGEGVSKINMNSMFYGCTNLKHLDIRGFTFDEVTNFANMFGQNTSSYVPANCEIIVKSQTEKDWMNTNFSRLTNVKTVEEYENS